ncbi:MAG: metal-dependent transcriptional regulator [Thermoplasmata archaeon]|nr:metal-dependent transcriptional regulator [Thermoplasmata archaeon]
MNELKCMKEIYRAYEDGISIVGPSEIAKRLDISKSTAHSLLKNLASLGYGNYVEKKGFVINSYGIKMGKQIMKKHRLIECFMADVFSLPPEKACREADKIDYLIGEEVIEIIERKYERVEKCPCGKRIPR